MTQPQTAMYRKGPDFQRLNLENSRTCWHTTYNRSVDKIPRKFLTCMLEEKNVANRISYLSSIVVILNWWRSNLFNLEPGWSTRSQVYLPSLGLINVLIYLQKVFDPIRCTNRVIRNPWFSIWTKWQHSVRCQCQFVPITGLKERKFQLSEKSYSTCLYAAYCTRQCLPEHSVSIRYEGSTLWEGTSQSRSWLLAKWLEQGGGRGRCDWLDSKNISTAISILVKCMLNFIYMNVHCYVGLIIGYKKANENYSNILSIYKSTWVPRYLPWSRFFMSNSWKNISR